jgi:hypothetical protein
MAFFAALKAGVLLGILTAAIYFGLPYTPFGQYQHTVLAIALGLYALRLLHIFQHYTHTYLQIDQDGLVYRKGWIPSYQNSIYWITIKDVDCGSTITESMLGCGHISILVTIRNTNERIVITYLPHHQQYFEAIRARLGLQSAQTRNVSFT